MQSDLGAEYAELARAFDDSFDEMVAIALAGVDATWLTASEQAVLRSRISAAATELASSILGSDGPAARLVPIGVTPQREFGFDDGLLRVPDDFDAPMPGDRADAFEG